MGFRRITRKGKSPRINAEADGLKSRNDGPVRSRRASVSVVDVTVTVHPTLEGKVRPHLLGSDFEAAVLVAFKEVEIRIRRCRSFPAIAAPLDT